MLGRNSRPSETAVLGLITFVIAGMLVAIAKGIV
jgi:hypothetical protein